MASAADKRRIVLLGKTGEGKSSTANSILGEEDEFTVGNIAGSTTEKCIEKGKLINGKQISVIDTPGFFDTGKETAEERFKDEMPGYITKCSSGVHAFVILLSVRPYTRQEEEVVQKITDIFSEEAFKYAVILFTHGDQLNNQTIEAFVKTNAKLDELVQKCGGRCHVIDNKYWNQEHSYRSNKIQLKELMDTIEEMVAENGGQCYTTEVLQATEAALRQTSEKEVTWAIKAAGLATGALLGAVFGIPVAIAAGAVHIGKALVCLLQVLKKMSATPEEVAALRRAVGGVGTVGSLGAGGTVGTVAEGGLVSAGVAYAVTGIMAVSGAIAGGCVGLQAAKGANSPGEAVGKAAKAVVDSSWKMVKGTNQAEYQKFK